MKLHDSPYVEELEARGVAYEARSPHYVYILCPYHDDKNPSLSISIERGDIRCWGCGERGSFYKLLAIWDGVPEKEAEAEGLSRPAGLLAWKQVESFYVDPTPSSGHYDISAFCNTFPSALGYPQAVNYLAGRGLPAAVIDYFGLRWGTSGKYKDRVVIPIFDVRGRLLSYAARSVHSKKVPKTRKPRRAQGTLFGLWNLVAKRERWPFLVVVEGEFDCMYLQWMGVPAVAAMGTAGLTDDQIAVLVAYADSAVLSYDGDKAGRDAMFGREKVREDTGEKYLTTRGDLDRIRVYMPAQSIVLPDGKDPNNLSKGEVRKYYRSFTAA